jgi:uncharacterized protein (DUF2141 family)
MKKLLITGSILSLLAFGLLTGPGCANIVPPQGGPRDSLPPRLLKVVPADSSTNVHSKTVEFTFDEFIDLQDTRNNLTISPMFELQPTVTAKLRTLTVKLQDSLEANTTYTINFGNAIRDINEGNVLRDFSYAFSTGPALDSLTLSGQVQLAETGGVDSTLTVVLYRSMQDSAVSLQTPRYITRLDREGKFQFRNLPSGTFAVYAFDDESRTRRYLQKTQLFAFLDSPVVSGSNKTLMLNAYREQPKGATVANTGRGNTTAQTAADKRLKFTTPSGPQDLAGDYRIQFDNKIRAFDSAKIRLTKDSIYTAVPAKFGIDSTGKAIVVGSRWEAGASYNLIIEKDFATDSTGRSQLRNDTLRFTARKPSGYGKLQLRFRNVDAAHNPVLQFVQNGSVVFSAPISSGTLNRDLFIPGEYDLRLLYDTNGNGRWDAGRFFGGKKQPELVKQISRKLTVKADMDNEVEIAL